MEQVWRAGSHIEGGPKAGLCEFLCAFEVLEVCSGPLLISLTVDIPDARSECVVRMQTRVVEGKVFPPASVEVSDLITLTQHRKADLHKMSVPDGCFRGLSFN